jgi:DnaJ-class molecular chaperone
MPIRNTIDNPEPSIRNKKFDFKKYQMVLCPSCQGAGYIKDGKRHACSKCGGFGHINERAEQNLEKT